MREPVRGRVIPKRQELARLLRAARVWAGFNQKKAAATAGMSQSRISKLERLSLENTGDELKKGLYLAPSFMDMIVLADTYNMKSLEAFCRPHNREREVLDRIIKREFRLRSSDRLPSSRKRKSPRPRSQAESSLPRENQ